jgi:large subunit ribosomal protein L18
MKIKFSKHTSPKTVNRLKKKIRIRKVVNGSAERPRLCVFRSTKHIYAQIINDATQSTVLTISSLSLDSKLDGKETAKQVGLKIAQEANKKGIKQVVFDRNGFIYHGRVQSLAEGAREGGLNF